MDMQELQEKTMYEFHQQGRLMEEEVMMDPRYKRDLKEDLKTAVDLFFEFKLKLDELNPQCKGIVYNLFHGM